MARQYAREALEKSAFSYEDETEVTDAFRQDLFQIARTTLSSKLLTYEKDYFANLAVDAVLSVKAQGL